MIILILTDFDAQNTDFLHCKNIQIVKLENCSNKKTRRRHRFPMSEAPAYGSSIGWQ
jgi:hypothetical protein